MDWRTFDAKLRAHAAAAALTTYGSVDDGVGSFPLYRLTTPGDAGSCVITAGFHGDEQAGPITIAEHLSDIVAYARERDVALTIYPCLNPSGFDACTRYNRLGERPNNDVLRYELADGTVVDQMPTPRPFSGIHPRDGGPAETRALIADIRDAAPPTAALDLHQDPYFGGSLGYAYYFGAPAPYVALMERTARLVPIARDREVDVGVFSDAHGLIVLHDGSVSDWYWRRGARYVAVVETNTDTPMPTACAVNMVWIEGFIDLCAAA